MNGSGGGAEKRAFAEMNNNKDLESPVKTPRRHVKEEEEEGMSELDKIIRFKKEALWRQFQDQKSKATYYREAYERVQRNNDNLQRIERFIGILAQEFAPINTSNDNDDDGDKGRSSILLELIGSPNPELEENLVKFWKNLLDKTVSTLDPGRLDEFGKNVAFAAKIEQLEAKCSETETRLSETEERLWMAERRSRRLEMQLAMLEDNGSNTNTNANATPLNTDQQSEAAQNSTASTNVLFKAQLESLEQLARQRLAELERADEERRSLKGQLLRLKESISRIPTSVFQDPRQYAHLQGEVKRLWEELRLRDGDLKRLQAYLEDRNRAQEQLMQRFDADLASRKSSLTGLLENLETDCTRLRKDRDQMRQMYEQSNNQVASQAKIISSLQESMEALQTENRVFKEENQRLIIARRRLDVGSDKILEEEAEALLMAEIETLGGTLDELQQTNRKLIEAMERRDEQYNQLLGEKLKIEFNLAQLQRESDLAKLRSSKLEQEGLALAAQAEARERAAREHCQGMERDLKEKTVIVDQLKWKLSDMTTQQSQIEANLESSRKAAEKTAAELTEKSSQLDRFEWEHRRSVEEVQQLRKKLEAYTSLNTPTMPLVKELKEEIDIYRKLLKCNSCHTRDKDTVLVKCMHAFCRTCIDTRLETRQRKCPNCGEPFGANDVRTVYL